MRSTPTRAGIAEAQDSAEDVGNFEYCAILNARHAGTKIIQAARDLRDALANGLEGIQHHSGAVFLHP